MADKSIPGRPSVPFFRMQGSSVHALGALRAENGVSPSFMQCFFMENTTGVTDRTDTLDDANQLALLQAIFDEVKEFNPFYRTLKTILESPVANDAAHYHMVLSDVAPVHASGPRTYNAPTAIEVGGIILGQPGESAPRAYGGGCSGL